MAVYSPSATERPPVIFPDSGFLPRRNMTLAVESDVKPYCFLPSLNVINGTQYKYNVSKNINEN